MEDNFCKIGDSEQHHFADKKQQSQKQKQTRHKMLGEAPFSLFLYNRYVQNSRLSPQIYMTYIVRVLLGLQVQVEACRSLYRTLFHNTPLGRIPRDQCLVKNSNQNSVGKTVLWRKEYIAYARCISTYCLIKNLTRETFK